MTEPTNLTTTKQVADYLWEWAESKGHWALLLVNEIVKNGCKPGDEFLAEVFKHYLKQGSNDGTLPALNITKPVYADAHKSVVLKELSDVQGVNRLGNDQLLEFAKNLTVVYGNNGSGKTGYARILKSLGQSYSAATPIYSNVYGQDIARTCNIGYEADGIAHTVPWTDKSKIADLATVSVFTNHCVAASLNPQRGLMVVPSGFHLFQLVTESLQDLSSKQKQVIQNHPTKIGWIDQLHSGTPQFEYLSFIHAKSPVDKLEEIASYNSDEETKLSALQLSLKNLNSALLANEIAEYKAQSHELATLSQSINECSTKWSEENHSALMQLYAQRKTLENRSVAGLAEIAGRNNVPKPDSESFTNLLHAAEAYIQALERASYPTSGDTCVYCSQPLSDSAIELLAAYRKVLNDTTQRELTQVVSQMAELRKKLTRTLPVLTLSRATFGESAVGVVQQPAALVTLKKVLTDYHEAVSNETANRLGDIKFPYEDILEVIESKQAQLKLRISEKELSLQRLAEIEEKLKAQINELLDRKFISGKVEDIKTIIKNNALVGTLNDLSRHLNTTPISNKTTEAREQLVKHRFDEIFKSELAALRKESLKVNVDFSTVKGASQLKQSVATRNVSDILSEGEQKAIAMAEFLTEIQLDGSDGPVVFDDPVNSLDHHLLKSVATRLLKLSESRQVIIFTHHVILLNLLMDERESDFKHLDAVFYRTQTRDGETGLLFPMKYGRRENFENYAGQIKDLLQSSKHKPPGEVAVKAYDLLRAGIEGMVENSIFGYVVRRYRPNITMTGLMDVDGASFEQHKKEISEIFARCCSYITAHTNAEESNYEPTMEEFDVDFARMQEIRKAFPKK